MTGLLIFGANSLARMLIELIREDGGQVDGVVVDDAYAVGPTFHGVPLVELSTILRPRKMVSAIGYRNMRARREVFERLTAAGHELTNFVSSHAVVSRSAEMGVGNVVMPGVIIEPLAKIGTGNLFWSGSLVCHEVQVGNHNYVSAHCVLGGHSRVGDLCFVGNSSTTIDGVVVADETHVLPGSVLYENTEPHTKYIGAPARPVGRHAATGIVVER